MAIRVSHELHPDLGCEALVFLDEESDGCFQIQRDLGIIEAADRYCVTTGASAPVYGGIVQWRRVGDRFEFALTKRAAVLFDDEVLSFDVVAADGSTIDQLAEHVDRLIGSRR
ncbi:hypothetical protein [Gordonia effusa]|uniref:hypothetical protein n=1 Tax=Gordonia effusa TaxID=263908 RepID=UPI000310E98E|nr:hypothetical protein [Gordonia effusa]